MKTDSQEMHQTSSPICIPHISDYPIFWVCHCHLGVSAYKILVSCRRIVREWRETRWQKYMYLYCRFITTNIPCPCFCWRKNIILIKFHLPSIPLAVQFIIALLLFCKETKLLAGDDINHWGGGGCARKYTTTQPVSKWKKLHTFTHIQRKSFDHFLATYSSHHLNAAKTFQRVLIHTFVWLHFLT